MGLYDHEMGASIICTYFEQYEIWFLRPYKGDQPRCEYIVKVWLYKSIAEQSSRQINQIVALTLSEI